MRDIYRLPEFSQTNKKNHFFIDVTLKLRQLRLSIIWNEDHVDSTAKWRAHNVWSSPLGPHSVRACNEDREDATTKLHDACST